MINQSAARYAQHVEKYPGVRCTSSRNAAVRLCASAEKDSHDPLVDENNGFVRSGQNSGNGSNSHGGGSRGCNGSGGVDTTTNTTIIINRAPTRRLRQSSSNSNNRNETDYDRIPANPSHSHKLQTVSASSNSATMMLSGLSGSLILSPSGRSTTKSRNMAENANWRRSSNAAHHHNH